MPVLSNYSYLQFIAAYEPLGHLIRVYTAIHSEPLSEITEMLKGRSFRVLTRLDAALAPPPLVRVVGKLPLDQRDSTPAFFRLTKPNSAGFSQVLGPDGSGIFDKVLTDDEMTWPGFPGVYSHASLLHFILKDNGIDVPVTDLVVDGGDDAKDGEALFSLYFNRKRDAAQAARTLSLPGFRSSIRKIDSSWLWLVIGRPTEPIANIESQLTAIAEANGGKYDGNELPMDIADPGGASRRQL
jgi:hypothetical protein